VRLILLTVIVAAVVGLLAGGRLSDFPSVRLKRPWLAVVGVILQFLPVGGDLGFAILLASFAALLGFTIVNLRAPGFALIVVGLALNVTVIGANHGMPVTSDALIRSDQADTLHSLITDGGAKHHLATGDTVLRPLADVIPIGDPVRQVVSVGDLFVHLGVGWFIVMAMRRRREETRPAEAGVEPGTAG
jgi:hypothetical protein